MSIGYSTSHGNATLAVQIAMADATAVRTSRELGGIHAGPRRGTLFGAAPLRHPTDGAQAVHGQLDHRHQVCRGEATIRFQQPVSGGEMLMLQACERPL